MKPDRAVKLSEVFLYTVQCTCRALREVRAASSIKDSLKEDLGPWPSDKDLGKGGAPQVQSLAELQRALEASLGNLIRVSQRGLRR